jgi:hypothetical protein
MESDMMHRLRALTVMAYLGVYLGGCTITVSGSKDSSSKDSSQQGAPTASPSVQQSGGGSCLAIVGGAPTCDFQAVVFLLTPTDKLWTCTGTALSDTTLITASHCVVENPNGNAVYIPGNVIDLSDNSPATPAGIAAVKAFIGNTAVTLDKPEDADAKASISGKETDMAIVLFPPGTFRSTAKIRWQAPSPNQDVTMVGYGNITADDSAPQDSGPVRTKRQGRNHLAAIDSSTIAAILQAGGANLNNFLRHRG